MGTGKPKLEKKLKALDEQYPNVKGVVKFSTPIAHTLFAGTDYMVIPSPFEPCGLIQLQAMSYGSIPVATSVGGLVDTVKENKTGYLMPAVDLQDVLEKDTEAIAKTIKKVAAEFGSRKFFQLRYQCIGQDLTWKEPAKKWEGILEQTKFGVPAGVAKKEQVKTPVASEKLLAIA